MTQAEDRALEEKELLSSLKKIAINMISILNRNIKRSVLLKRLE